MMMMDSALTSDILEEPASRVLLKTSQSGTPTHNDQQQLRVRRTDKTAGAMKNS